MSEPATIVQKLLRVHFGLLVTIIAISLVGVALLYSVADGSWSPWATKHAIRVGLGLILLLGICVIDIKFWYDGALWFFGITILLLIAVEFFGTTRMGAQRWLTFGPLTLQPSELMKLALVLALARVYNLMKPSQVSKLPYVLLVGCMVFVPAYLVNRQPDLGTAVMIAVTGVAVIFTAGISWRWIGISSVLGLIGSWLAYNFVLHDYQKVRITAFLHPEQDPLGAGYHTLQSRIALGAGGMEGQGFLKGTQTHLDFVPEKHTDFIFPVLGEEFGFVGAVTLLALYVMLIGFAIAIGFSSRSHFGRLVCMGIAATTSLYVIINTAMVMGLAPVVGVPLPLVSYGGTVLLMTMIAFGIVMSVHIHQENRLGPRENF